MIKIMFAPIEDKDFKSNEYNSYLLGYRALTREIYAKDSAIDFIPQMRELDRGRKIQEQIAIQEIFNQYQLGSEKGSSDLLHYKNTYDKASKSSDFSASNCYIINFSNFPNILYSGAIYPEYDFKGSVLQDILSPHRLQSISVNAISLPSGGAVVFQWMGESEVNTKLMTSLNSIPDDMKASVVTQFAFESFENLFVRADWWNNISKIQSNNLSSRVMCGTPRQNHSPKCYINDRNNYYLWSNVKVSTNIEI